jgi:SAM-dependent methyltransferase
MFLNREALIIDERNRLKTQNHMGFAHLTPLKATKEFYHQAKIHPGRYADIGSAYGTDAIHVLKTGAHVVAIDLDQQHLDMMKEQLTVEEHHRLETRCQRFPEEVNLEPETFEGVLLSRILIFLTSASLIQALTKVYHALKPGGKVYVITASPFSDKWNAIQQPFEQHQKLVSNQPFFISNLWELLPQTRSFLPECIQLFDTNILQNVLKKRDLMLLNVIMNLIMALLIRMLLLKKMSTLRQYFN